MRIASINVRNHLLRSGEEDQLRARSKGPAPGDEIEEHKLLRHRQDQDQVSYCPEGVLLKSRVLIIEGVSGSGKDTFQAYLKEKLEGRDVYDFSEGELLHSWKHIPIEGILKLKVEFMKLFVNYLKEIVGREDNAVFLLNRFHLSTYASIKTRQPELMREYDKTIKVLRMLPVHVFILQLDESEIEKRSLHPERSGVWPKLQRQMVTKDGFRNRLEKYISQQSLMIEAAKRQPIPYSIIKFPGAPEIERAKVHVAEAHNIVRRGVRMNATDPKMSRRKRDLPRTL